MAIVRPNERVAMASLHNVGRSALGTAGPSVATALWDTVAVGAPFIACGVLKIAYDISLFFMLRSVRPPEEIRRAEERAAARQPASENLAEGDAEDD